MGRRPYKPKFYHNGKRCSKGEKKIAVFLDKHQINFVQEKTFDSCRSPKNNLLRFDFYLPDFNILIEYNGVHHYKPAHKYPKALRIHKQTVKHDKIKKIYVCANKIILLEIHHLDYNKIDDYLFNVLTDIYNELKGK